ncbi:MAG: exodeoxyribonuclease VII large subunit [Bacteriovoracaceae bacterium]|nr:exodeoxyribonuclease VII large subunit [Bacteriovoracaceae bacterium]
MEKNDLTNNSGEVEIPLTVGEISLLLKTQLEKEYRGLFLAGEIQNLTFSASGHYYFNLHGQDCALSCVLFKQYTSAAMTTGLQNGANVWLWGDISYYQKRGQIQLMAKKIQLGDKEGLLKLKLQQLKQKFLAKGYFEVARKKNIPIHPKKIAIVSGLGTAAIRDFITVYTRRSFHYSLLIFPALVQGESAVDSIISALTKIKARPQNDIDLVVVTRGGGSLEDLWCFNDEKLIEYVATQFSIPILSAIGHERDHTLLDLVSDKSLETPSAAAEFLSQRSFDQRGQFYHWVRLLRSQGQNLHNAIKDRKQRYSTERLVSLLRQQLKMEKSRLNNSTQRMAQSFLNRIQMWRYQIEESPKSMQQSLTLKCQQWRHQLEKYQLWLTAHHPKSVMEKGYCLAWDKDGHLIDRASKLKQISELGSLEFYDGKKNL